MKSRIWVLLVVLAVTAFFAGCTQPETTPGGTQETQTTQTTPEESGGSGAAEVTVPDEAKEVDGFIRPKLVSIFGSAKVTNYYQSSTPSGMGIALVYELGRNIEPADVNSLKNAIQSGGYGETFGSAQSEEGFSLMFNKESTVLVIGGDFGTNEITVVWGKG